MLQSEVKAHYRAQARLARVAQQEARAAWRTVDPANISGSWSAGSTALLERVTIRQAQAAGMAEDYHNAVIRAQGSEPVPDGAVNPRALSGVASDGRTLDSLLYLPAIEAKQNIGQGLSTRDALSAGLKQLVGIVGTQVADASRVADGLASYKDFHTSGYYRMLQPPSCSRCAILAGKFFRKNQGFQRHPRCDCVHVPCVEADDSLAFDARKAVEQGQVTGLSANETRAILDGADPSQVVNARRGMDAAGLYTREGTTRRGIAGARIITGNPTAMIAPRFGGDVVAGQQFTRLTKSGRTQTYNYRRARTPRPTPEAIYRFSTDRAEAMSLLKRFGYVI